MKKWKIFSWCIKTILRNENFRLVYFRAPEMARNFQNSTFKNTDFSQFQCSDNVSLVLNAIIVVSCVCIYKFNSSIWWEHSKSCVNWKICDTRFVYIWPLIHWFKPNSDIVITTKSGSIVKKLVASARYLIIFQIFFLPRIEQGILMQQEGRALWAFDILVN